MGMTSYRDWPCWEIMKCENSDNCIARSEPETPCWEIVGWLKDFRSAFNICTDCIVYMLHQDVSPFSKKEYQDILEKKGLSVKQEIDNVSRKPRKIYCRHKLKVTSPGL